MDLEKAIQTQLRNIQAKTGKSLDELGAILRATGLKKHGELRDYAQRELALGHGDANTLVTTLLSAAAPPASNAGYELDAIYAGPKAGLRRIHEKVMAALADWAPFEVAPKKTYVSLQRKKQFAMIGPATNTRVDVGLNMKGVNGTDRLEELPAGGMCQFKVRLTDPEQVDAELIAWMRLAFDQAG